MSVSLSISTDWLIWWHAHREPVEDRYGDCSAYMHLIVCLGFVSVEVIRNA